MNPTAAVLIIGNEILSGRTQDANIQYLGKRLSQLGIKLTQARVIPDEVPTIVSVVQELSANHTYVFTTGGLGFTHDDRTAEAIAQAFHVELVEHPEALRLLQAYYNDRLNAARRRMALIPNGAQLIPNLISQSPGFQMENVFVLAGVPNIMQVMLDSVVNRLTQGAPIRYTTIQCHLTEGVIADALTAIQQQHPDVEIGSYPHFQAGVLNLGLVMRGTDEQTVAAATKDVADMIRSFGGEPTIENH